jgi:zona occludens toxin
MIELITGLPGNGKTLYTIGQVKAQAEKENRPVYYHGIKLLPEGAPVLNWTELKDPKDWASVPPGSIVLIDEAQKTFRNRSLGTLPPSFVTDLETHRHLGIDLVMITQHPSLIDPAVRRLSGRHRHLVRLWGMEASTVHKWDSVKDNCDKSRNDSEKSKWAFDKTIFPLYRSAELHTMKRVIPFRVKMLACLPFLLIAAAYTVYSLVVKPKTVGPVSAHVVPGSIASLQGVTPSPAVAAKDVPFDPVADAKHFIAMNTARVAGLPQTAPKYDELTKPTRVPVPAMCLQSAKMCKCFTQQGTPMDVEASMCISFARNGFFQEFDPDKDRKETARADVGRHVMASRPDVSLSTGVPVAGGG